MGDPAVDVAITFARALAEAAPVLFRLFMSAGGRDGFLVAIDATLATIRAQTDADLARKHEE